MKRIAAVFTAVLIVSLVACGGSGGKYGDVKDFMNKIVDTQETYISSVEKATSPDDVVKAIEEFGNSIIAIAEKSEELRAKYPEMEKWDNNPPAELKSEYEKIEKSNEKMEQLVMNENVRKQMMDPKVMQAFMDLGKKMEQTKIFE